MADRYRIGKDPGRSPARGASWGAEDDFVCLRFKVRYPSFDCAVRTKFRTCGGCSDCDQGRFNFKRHAEALRGVRFPDDVR